MKNEFFEKGGTRKLILDSGFMIKSMKNGVAFEPALMDIGFKLAVVREDLQHVKDLRFTRKMDKEILKNIINLYGDRNVEKKSIGRREIKSFLIEKGKDGFFIGSTNQEVLRQVPRKIILNQDGIVVNNNGHIVEFEI